MRLRLALSCALFAFLIAGPAWAQNPGVRPYFLVIVDTSGSMSDALPNGTPAPSCAGYQSTKIGSAKCALTKIINATGDADFGLMQFAKANNNTDCNNAGTCDPVPAAAWLRVPIETNSWRDILPLIDNNGNGPADELCAGGNTPLGGVISAAKQYWQTGLNGFAPPTTGDSALACRPISVILLTDGDECCGNCANIVSATPTPSWLGCPNAHANVGITCAAGCSSAPTCPNNFFESAPELAYQMLTASSVPSAMGVTAKRIPTYAIGFGIAPGDTHIENIAKAGGTDSPGPYNGFYASDEGTLSRALTQIIADAQPPVEVCNNLDDDCDMLIDEGIPKYCDIPNGITDKTLCTPPAETVCDGKDDNCNGLIDEGLLNACGTCGAVPPEVCDGMDNDCDGRIDEEIPGGACGSSVGICMPGMLECVGGTNQCSGEVGPQPESCNCKDDDCDGLVDEDTANNLCPDGKCVGCVCVPHCTAGTEFMASCEHGLRPDIQPSGECLCVTDDCDAKSCSASTLMRDDEVACAPSDAKVAACLCLAGMCVARCDGVSCASGQICDKHDGRCVADNCIGLGCDTGELCDAMSGKCSKDACLDASCKPDEVCRDGMCEQSCASVACADTERCQAGHCVKDECAASRCAQGEVCDPASGKCIADVCGGKTCGEGLACAIASGDCERDPCFGVHCPAQQSCALGECQANNGGSPATVAHQGSDPNARVLATGGGGCSCRVASTRKKGGAPWAIALGLGLCLLWRRRRWARGSRWLVPGLLPLLSLPLSGCTVDPFCIDCSDAGRKPAANDSGQTGAAPDGSMIDGSSADAGQDAGPPDAAVTLPPACKDPQPETCNGKDDDCDFKVDEDTVAAVNDCTQLGICAGTSPICLNGAFTCRYPDEREPEETHCDGKDSDCDGRVDETFTALNGPCDIGVGACKVTGKQICNVAGDGLLCVATSTIDPADEICDGIDNDCDGMVDEPRSNPGSAPSFVEDDVVQVGANLWAYKYEASRPDATGSDQGIISSRACSRAGVLPWTNLTYMEALDACTGADMMLCQLADWITTCGGTNGCAFGYTPTGGGSCQIATSAYPTTRDACNGHDLTANPGAADTDALAPTGSFAQCFVDVQGGQVFDMSGNAKEWTTGSDSSSPDLSSGSSPLRGGSYNNLPGGMRCDFDFNVAGNQDRLPNVGFRCCSAAKP